MKTYVRRHKMIQIQPPKESPATEENLPPLIKSSPHDKEDTEEDILHLTLAQLVQSERRGRKKRNVNEQGNGTSAPEVLPEVSTLTRRRDICRTVGSVVWAKKAPHMWWPAEVLIRESPAPNSGTDVTEGSVFIQYYGSKECGLVDPARDLSPFEDRFEEKSSNPSEEFREALKQAVQKQQLNLTGKSVTSCEGHARCDTGNSTSSSRAGGSDCLEKGSRKRQKTEVQFNEVNLPSWPTNSRKMRSKRAVGLAPPGGAPAAQSPMQE